MLGILGGFKAPGFWDARVQVCGSRRGEDSFS